MSLKVIGGVPHFILNQSPNLRIERLEVLNLDFGLDNT